MSMTAEQIVDEALELRPLLPRLLLRATVQSGTGIDPHAWHS